MLIVLGGIVVFAVVFTVVTVGAFVLVERVNESVEDIDR